MFLNVEKIIPSKQMMKTKVQHPVTLSSVPSSAKPPHPSSRGDGQLVIIGACRRQSLAGSRCGHPHGDSDSKDTGPAPSVGATLFPPGSSRKENTVAHSPHSHSHSQAQKTLRSCSCPRRPGPATLLYLSRRPPPETNLSPQMSS